MVERDLRIVDFKRVREKALMSRGHAPGFLVNNARSSFYILYPRIYTFIYVCMNVRARVCVCMYVCMQKSATSGLPSRPFSLGSKIHRHYRGGHPV